MKETAMNEKAPVNDTEIKWTRSIGARIFIWIVALFFGTLVLFVALDINNELRSARGLGASERELAFLWLKTLRLHAVHGAVTILLFGIGIYLVVHRLVTRRIEAIISAIKRFRIGIWKARIPRTHGDEIEWLADTFRQLGPYLENQIQTFVEVDRKAVAARLGKMYEARLTPKVKKIFSLADSFLKKEKDRCAWFQVKQESLEILNELELLGRPEHLEILRVINFREALDPELNQETTETMSGVNDSGTQS